MKKCLAILMVFALTGCFLDVMSTTATTSKLQVENAKTAKRNGDTAKDSVAKSSIQNALKTYAAEKGSNPGSLDDLVPDYLPVLPKKADGTEFGYDASTGKVE